MKQQLCGLMLNALLANNVMLAQGTIAAARGQGEQAQAYYEKALQVEPTAELHNNYGAFLFRRGDLQRAIEHYQFAHPGAEPLREIDAANPCGAICVHEFLMTSISRLASRASRDCAATGASH